MSHRCSVSSIFAEVESLVQALRRLKEAGLRDLSVYSPVGLPELEPLLPKRGSPVRFIALAAGLLGLAGAFWMCIGSARIYDLIVGGKPPAAALPYWVIGFELTVLLAGVTALGAVVVLARLRPASPPPDYDPRFGQAEFGICVFCPEDQVSSVARLLREAGGQEVHGQPQPGDRHDGGD